MEVIKLNLIPGKACPVVHVSQFDDGREFKAELYEGVNVYTLDGTETLTAIVKKPDGNEVTAAVTNTSDNYVIITTTEQMTACAGGNLGTLRIEKGAVTIATLNFILECQASPDTGIQSDSEIHNLETQVNQMVEDAVAEQYDSNNVLFDTAPTSGHGVPYAVTSGGLWSWLRDLPLRAYPTASGAIATFDTSLALPLQDLQIAINGTNLTGANIGYVDFNQLVSNGNFVDTSDWYSSGFASFDVSSNVANLSTPSSSATCYLRCGATYIVDHKYLITATAKASSSSNVTLSPNTNSFNATGVTTKTIGADWSAISSIFIADNTSNALRIGYRQSNMPISATLNVKNAMLFDLTQMFGTTIADYIYGLEQDTSGSGVAKFKELFILDYYVNTAGGTKVSIDSVNREPTCPNAQVSWNDLGTVSEGTLDVTTGKLTVVNGSMGAGDYQITPIPINQLSGTNNIFCDTGNTSVVYACSLKDYIDSQ